MHANETGLSIHCKGHDPEWNPQVQSATISIGGGQARQMDSDFSDDDILAAVPRGSDGSVVLGKYRIEKQLGRGGMGTVYLASHLELGSRVAIKCLRADPNNRRTEGIARLKREA